MASGPLARISTGASSVTMQSRKKCFTKCQEVYHSQILCEMKTTLDNLLDQITAKMHCSNISDNFIQPYRISVVPVLLKLLIKCTALTSLTSFNAKMH